MQRFEHVVVNQNGTFLPGVSVAVNVANASPGTGAAASLFSDEGITGTGNPATSDSNGRVVFYVADGKYDLTFSGVGITTYIRAAIEIADMTGTTFAADVQGKFNTLAVSSNATVGGTLVVTGAFTAGSFSNNLSVFAATTSAQLAGVISDETGSGALVFNNTPTFITPVLGAATATSIQQLAATTFLLKDNTGGTRASVPSNGTSQGTLNNWNLTGGSSISGTAIGGTSGSGNVLFDTSPTITTPTIARETINTGVSQGSGVKHQRFGATNATAAAAGSTATTAYSWTTPFADANYTVVVTGVTQTNDPAISVESITASGFTVRVTSISGAAAYGAVHAIAFHD